MSHDDFNNANVACLYRLFFTMSQVEFKKSLITCHYLFKLTSHVTRAHVALSNLGVNTHSV